MVPEHDPITSQSCRHRELVDDPGANSREPQLELMQR